MLVLRRRRFVLDQQTLLSQRFNDSYFVVDKSHRFLRFCRELGIIEPEQFLALRVNEERGIGDFAMKPFVDFAEPAEFALAAAPGPQQPTESESKRDEETAIEQGPAVHVNKLAPKTSTFLLRVHHRVDGPCTEPKKEAVKDLLVAIQHVPPPVLTRLPVRNGVEMGVRAHEAASARKRA